MIGMVTTGELVMILLGCVLVQGFFVSAEVALSACDRNALRTRAAGGGGSAARAERMLAVPQVTLATTLVGANLATLVAVLVLALERSEERRVGKWCGSRSRPQ